MDPKTHNKIVFLAFIIAAVTAIGAIFWGWSSITGQLPYFFSKTITRTIYGIIGIAGIILGILLIWWIISIISKPKFKLEHLFTIDWMYY